MKSKRTPDIRLTTRVREALLIPQEPSTDAALRVLLGDLEELEAEHTRNNALRSTVAHTLKTLATRLTPLLSSNAVAGLPRRAPLTPATGPAIVQDLGTHTDKASLLLDASLACVVMQHISHALSEIPPPEAGRALLSAFQFHLVVQRLSSWWQTQVIPLRATPGRNRTVRALRRLARVAEIPRGWAEALPELLDTLGDLLDDTAITPPALAALVALKPRVNAALVGIHAENQAWEWGCQHLRRVA